MELPHKKILFGLTVTMLVVFIFGVGIENISTPVARAATVDQATSGAFGVGSLPDGTYAGGPAPGKSITDSLSKSQCNSFASCIAAVVYLVTVGIGSAFAYVAAIFFSFAVALSLSGLSYALDFVAGGWTIARDIANMFFILLLVYIAFSIMLNADTAGTMRMLAMVIFVALIVNFSFFITRVVIDTSNLFAIQFYNAIQVRTLSQTLQSSGQTGAVPSTAGQAALSLTGASANVKDLTENIMNALQLQNLQGLPSFQKFQQNSSFLTELISLVSLYVTAGIFLWILTVAFVTNGIKFLMRVVVLWLVIVASPLAFVAATIPQTKSWFTQWRDVLVSYSIYPVVFMFVFLILNYVMKGLSASCSPVDSSTQSTGGCLIGALFSSLANVNPNIGFIGSIGITMANIGIRLGLVIALLYIGMKAADHIGLLGADFAGKMGGKVGGWYSGALKWAGKQPVRGAATAGAAAGGLAYRPVGWIAQKAAGKIAGTGYFGYRAKKALGSVAETTFGGVQSLKSYQTNRQAELSTRNTRATIKKAADGTPLTPDEQSTIKKLGKNELGALGAGEVRKLTPLLSSDQIKLIEGVDKFTDQQKRDIKDDWKKAQQVKIEEKTRDAKTQLASPGGVVSDVNKKKVQSVSIQEMKSMDTAELKNLASLFSEEQKKKFDDLEISETDKQELKDIWTEKSEDAPLQIAARKLKDAVEGIGTLQTKINNAKGTTPNLLLDKNWFETNVKDELKARLNTTAVAWNTSKTSDNHAAWQEAQERLKSYEEFEKARKNVESQTNINNNGDKGTLKAQFLPAIP